MAWPVPALIEQIVAKGNTDDLDVPIYARAISDTDKRHIAIERISHSVDDVGGKEAEPYLIPGFVFTVLLYLHNANQGKKDAYDMVGQLWELFHGKPDALTLDEWDVIDIQMPTSDVGTFIEDGTVIAHGRCELDIYLSETK